MLLVSPTTVTVIGGALVLLVVALIVWGRRARLARALALLAAVSGVVGLVLLVTGQPAREGGGGTELARETEPPGTVVIPYQGEAKLVLRRVVLPGSKPSTPAGRLTVESSDGTFSVPPGVYRLSELTVSADDEEHGHWEAQAPFYDRKNKEITVVSGETLQLEAGPPLQVRITVLDNNGKRVVMGYEVRGLAGDSFLLTYPNQMENVPEFEVVDAQGQVVWTDKFEYG